MDLVALYRTQTTPTFRFQSVLNAACLYSNLK